MSDVEDPAQLQILDLPLCNCPKVLDALLPFLAAPQGPEQGPAVSHRA
jgi:hypothetical protein